MDYVSKIMFASILLDVESDGLAWQLIRITPPVHDLASQLEIQIGSAAMPTPIRGGCYVRQEVECRRELWVMPSQPDNGTSGRDST